MYETEEAQLLIKSSIRDRIFRVLARYASSGDLGPISIKRLFLIIADELVEAGIIERPEFLGGKSAGGQRFVQLAVSHPTDIFPDYGIPDNIANFIRQTFWELYLQGIFVPASNFRAIIDKYNQEKRMWISGGLFLDLDHVRITSYGVELLTDTTNRIQVHDPDGYLANFWNVNPPPDAEMMRYLSECVSVFRSGHLLATIILLGVTSERLIEVLAESLRDALGEPCGTEWFQSKYENKRDISVRFKSLAGKLMGEYGEELNRQKLKDGFQSVVTLTFEEIRLARNDIAHLGDREFTWNEVSGLLFHFVQYFGYVNRIIAFLAGKSKGG